MSEIHSVFGDRGAGKSALEQTEPQSNKIKDKKLNAEKKQRKVKKDDKSAEKTGGKKAARKDG